MKNLHKIITIVFLLVASNVSAQEFTSISGVVSDKSGDPLERAHILILELDKGTYTSKSGRYNINVPSEKELTVFVSYITKSKTIKIKPLKKNERRELNLSLNVSLNLKTVDIVKKRSVESEQIPFIKIDPEVFDLLPAVGEKTITILKTLPGVYSNTELSSGYAVRGGNFDENLVYINDVEIYRPFLIRSGQQEGLPIINSDMVESIKFSAGGFEAKYGDKLSSVLDIKYRRPTENHAGFTLNLLGASAFVEGQTSNRPFRYIIGARQRSNSYFLNSLDVEGDYNTNFVDVQSVLAYDLNEHWNLELFTYYGQNKYNLVPQTQTTDYGTSSLVLRFKVYFDGQEITQYQNFLNALNLTYDNEKDLKLKLSGSAYTTSETEYFDIQGQYWLDQVDKDTESETFDSTLVNFGVGSFLDHARNTLNANIYNVKFKGQKIFQKSDLKWGASVQFENITDKLREWNLRDSSDYIIPKSTGEFLELNEFINTSINLKSTRYSGYIQNTFELNKDIESFLTAGIRANYWDYNNEVIVTPRVQFVIEPYKKRHLEYIIANPNDSDFFKRVQFKASAGMYHQPAFYRELRDRQGILNPNIRAQKSYQMVLGSDVYFKMWNRKFKWTTELYYKYLDDIVPYDVEDVRIRYHAKNYATGYATGVDMQLYGEFVKGLPSWANISLMQTRENLEGDWTFVYDEEGNRVETSTGEYVTQELQYIPRPTDQRFRAAIFFQDFLPQNPNNKVNLNLVYATPIPFGPPQFEHLRNQFRMRSYKRIDVGFSRLLVSREDKVGYERKFSQNFESIWLSAEIFNMFGFRNVISYFWVKDINNAYWGVPNYLTRRRFNVSLSVRF